MSISVIRNNRIIPAFQWLALFVPVFIYLFYMRKYALDIPTQDDYSAVLDFLNKYKTLSGADKFWLLFSQHGEHRIFSSRIVYVVYNSIFGHINFRSLTYIGNSQLVVVYMLAIYFIKRALPTRWFLPALAAGFCIFDLNNWENTTFAMACMQNYGVIMLLLATLFFYSKPAKQYIPLAVLTQLVCIYSSGNGMVAVAFVVLFNILQQDRLKAIVSGLAFVVFAPLYFLHYVTPPTGHPSSNIGKIAAYFFNVVSGRISFGGPAMHLIIGVAAILILLLVLPISKRLKMPKEMLPFICISGFVLGSMAVTSIFRSNVAGVIPNSSRYMIYPNLLMALIIIFAAYKLKDKFIGAPVTVAFLLLTLYVYKQNFANGEGGLQSFYNAKLQPAAFYPDQNVANAILDASCKNGVYCRGVGK